MNFRSTIVLVMTTITLNSFSNGPKKSSETRIPDQISISFKLKKHEQCRFDYSTSFLESRTLVFSNPGNTDTVLIKTISSKTPVSFSYSIIDPDKDSKWRSMKYILLGMPGDTLHLSYIKQGFLNTSECKVRNIIAASDTSFYAEENYRPSTEPSSKEGAWMIFIQRFDKKYSHELDRINNLLSRSKIDTIFYKQLTINCKLHYYKRLLDWTLEGGNAYFKPGIKRITEKMTEIGSTLNDDDIFLSDDLLPVIDGSVRVKLINNGADHVNGLNVYNGAAASDIGKFKPAYLAVCLVRSPVKTGAGFNKTMSDYKQRYKNSIYSAYADSVLKIIFKVENIPTGDALVTIDGASYLFGNMIKKPNEFIVIDLWASWCAPCRAQLPYMDSIRKVMKRYPVRFITINIDEKIDNWKTASKAEEKYLKTNNYHLAPKKSALVKMLKIYQIPRYLVLKNARIISSDFYQPAEPSFVKELTKLMVAESN